MLVIVNPYATTVSDRLKNLVVYALRGSYQVDAIDTESRDHATELCREAAREGYDVVVAFGGDGTVNEAANGLAGSDTPLSCLPGGRTNVYCRMLGIPTDVVDATEHLLRIADDWRPRRVDLGRVNERYFAVLGRRRARRQRRRAGRRPPAAEGPARRVVLHVDGDPDLQPPLPAPSAAARGRRSATERVSGRDRDRPERRPVHVLRRPARRHGRGRDARQRRPRRRRAPAREPDRHPDDHLARALQARRGSTRHRRVHAVRRARRRSDVRSLDERPLPLQVDGDYIGEAAEVAFEVAPGGITVVA